MEAKQTQLFPHPPVRPNPLQLLLLSCSNSLPSTEIRRGFSAAQNNFSVTLRVKFICPDLRNRSLPTWLG